VKVALSPSTQSKPGDNLTRCIKFTMYPDGAIQAPYTFEQDITFGGGFDFIGKAKDVIKVPGHGRWSCISAWDQLHTLRSCYLIDMEEDCVDGVLHAVFAGDPVFGGNWLVSGNLDGFKKNIEGSNPSLHVIDILDYGHLQAAWGTDYGTGDTPCARVEDGTEDRHADIDGDGLVGLSDYAFVSMNFLRSAKECCGALLCVGGPYDGQACNDDGDCLGGSCSGAFPAAGAGNVGITEISVQELRLMGLGDLGAGDLNGDGLLNVDDMNAFNQGSRPAVKGMRGVRKDGGTR
jgi:hypothetical protein